MLDDQQVVKPAAAEARAAADTLRAAGFATVPTCPDEKKPTAKGWTSRVLPPDAHCEDGWGVGIVTGWMSPGPARVGHVTVCVDIDDPAVIEPALAILPHTAMRDGRPGKPDSHFWYLIPTDTIPEAEVPAGNAAYVAAGRAMAGHAGCRKRQWKTAAGTVAFEVQASGQHACVPPTMTKTGPREWSGGPAPGERGEPAVVPYPVLRAKLDELAAAVGATLAGKPAPAPDASQDDEPAAPPTAPPSDAGPAPEGVVGGVPVWERVRRAELWLKGIPDADVPCDANNGRTKTHHLCRVVVNDFAVPEDEAVALFLREMEPRLVAIKEPWGEDGWREEVRKAVEAGANPAYPFGCKLKPVGAAAPGGPDEPPRTETDPKRLAESFTTPVVCFGDKAFLHDGECYRPASDESFDAAVRDAVDASLADSFGDRVAAHERTARAALDAVELELRPKLDAAGHKEQREAVEATLEARRAKASEKLERKRPKAVTPTTLHLVAETRAVVRADNLLTLDRMTDRPLDGWWRDGRPGHFLSLPNGLLDTDTLEVRPHTPDYFGVYGVPVPYLPDAPDPERFLKFLGTLTCGDDSMVAVTQEVFGACLDPWLTLKFFVGFVGDGDNGKSVLFTVLGSLLGSRNVANVSLDSLGTNRFASFGLLGKLANLIGDQQFFHSSDEGLLKQLTGGDAVPYEQKGKDAVYARNTAKVLFNCNTLPRFADPSGALWRRVIPLPLEHVVTKPDVTLLDPRTWQPELPGVMRWSVDGLRRLKANKAFTRCERSEALKAQHRLDCDTALQFLADHYEAGTAADTVTNDTLYEQYETWCRNTGNDKARKGNMAFFLTVKRAFPEAKKSRTKSERGWAGIRFTGRLSSRERDVYGQPRREWKGEE